MSFHEYPFMLSIRYHLSVLLDSNIVEKKSDRY